MIEEIRSLIRFSLKMMVLEQLIGRLEIQMLECFDKNIFIKIIKYN